MSIPERFITSQYWQDIIGCPVAQHGLSAEEGNQSTIPVRAWFHQQSPTQHVYCNQYNKTGRLESSKAGVHVQRQQD